MPVFVLSRRQLLVWLFLAVIYGGGADAAAWAQADDPAFRAQRFIQALGLDLIDAAADQTLTRATRSERLRTLFHRGFDSPSIARFVLGRYWTVATPAERQEYLTLFEDMVVRFCARRFNLARGAAFRVTGGRPESDRDVVVVTELWLAKGRPVSVAWRVREGDRRLAIVDVEVAGLSMSLTQRQAVSAEIQATGGNIKEFLQHLRQSNTAQQ